MDVPSQSQCPGQDDWEPFTSNCNSLSPAAAVSHYFVCFSLLHIIPACTACLDCREAGQALTESCHSNQWSCCSGKVPPHAATELARPDWALAAQTLWQRRVRRPRSCLTSASPSMCLCWMPQSRRSMARHRQRRWGSLIPWASQHFIARGRQSIGLSTYASLQHHSLGLHEGLGARS